MHYINNIGKIDLPLELRKGVSPSVKYHTMKRQKNILKMLMVALLVSGVVACQRGSSGMNNTANDNQAASDSTSRGGNTKLELAPNQIRATERGGSIKQEAIKIDTAKQQAVPATRFSSEP